MPLALHVPYYHLPTFHSMAGKPSIYIHAPHADTHSIKPGSGDNLPWTRSTNGRRPMTSQDNLLQLSRQGTHGAQLPQTTCPMSTGLTDGRGPASGSQDRRSERDDE